MQERVRGRDAWTSPETRCRRRGESGYSLYTGYDARTLQIFGVSLHARAGRGFYGWSPGGVMREGGTVTGTAVVDAAVAAQRSRVTGRQLSLSGWRY